MARISPEEAGGGDVAGGKNVCAFLDMIAYSEGTAGRGDDGYNVIVGGALFNDYSHHPDILVALPKLGISSSAAGRGQIIFPTWRPLQDQLQLPDFSPLSQDIAMVELIRQRGAYDAVKNGFLEQAITLCEKEWASLPGAGYNQPEQKQGVLVAAYTRAGGVDAEIDLNNLFDGLKWFAQLAYRFVMGGGLVRTP